MSVLDGISFGIRRRLPLILQVEAAECALACLGMVAGFHGFMSDLPTLRRRFPGSLKGATLATLVKDANQLGLTTRPLKLDLEDLNKLRLPCILHWSFNHFVVLKKVTANNVSIHDPGFGQRTLKLAEVSKQFTGVALELWPGHEFKAVEHRRRIVLRDLMGRVVGLHRSLGQIILLAAALEIFALAAPLFVQWVVDHAIVSADKDLLATLALGFGLLMLMQQSITVVRLWVIMHLGVTLNVQWRGNAFTHMLKLPLEYFSKRHLGDVVSRFTSLDRIQTTLTTSFIEAILDGVMALVTVTMMFIYSPTLAWISVAAIFLYALGRWAWFRPLRTATEAQIVHASKQSSHFLETVRGVKPIKLFQRQDERRSTWLTLLVDQINADLSTQKLLIAYRLLNGTLFGVENIWVIWWGASLAIEGRFSVGMLMAYLAYKSQFGQRISSLIDKFFELKMLQLHGERVADILLSDPERTHNRLVSSGQGNLSATIEVRDLRYRYAEHEPFVLDGVNFKLEEGESVAIVGPSGCGKSTLLHVLLGVLTPTHGEILVGGANIQNVGVDQARNMIGTVMQDDVLFAGSIADNISFFDPQADQDWIEECAKQAAIHAVIAAMPMGYNTLVGDMGTVLSGGQKQLVLLARAFYKRPKILLLDEATSHLDAERERMVNASIKAMKITKVVVAHRAETIASASRVIALHEGKIARDGRLPGSVSDAESAAPQPLLAPAAFALRPTSQEA